MPQPAELGVRPPSTRRRRVIFTIVTTAVIVGALLVLVFVPYNFTAKEIQVSSGAGTTTSLTIPQAGWVTVHFDHPYRMGMSTHYWVQGSGGMMMDHSTMGSLDTYSFWSWGGTYRCGAGYLGTGSSTMAVWVYATWGLL
jgi:hypothetical protein